MNQLASLVAPAAAPAPVPVHHHAVHPAVHAAASPSSGLVNRLAGLVAPAPAAVPVHHRPAPAVHPMLRHLARGKLLIIVLKPLCMSRSNY